MWRSGNAREWNPARYQMQSSQIQCHCHHRDRISPSSAPFSFSSCAVLATMPPGEIIKTIMSNRNICRYIPGSIQKKARPLSRDVIIAKWFQNKCTEWRAFSFVTTLLSCFSSRMQTVVIEITAVVISRLVCNTGFLVVPLACNHFWPQISTSAVQRLNCYF